MRVLIDCHCYDGNTTEGINIYIKGVYTHLIPMMPEVDFYLAAHRTDRLKKIFGEAANVHYVKLPQRNRLLRLLSEYRSVVKKFKIDIAHFQYFAPPWLGCRTLITTHDLIFKDFPDRFPLDYRLSRDIFFRLSSKNADLLATVSEYSRGRIAAHYGIPADKILLTRNGVGNDFFNISEEKAKEFAKTHGVRRYILNVSRIEPRKNQLSLVRAYHELNLAERGYDLVLINQPTIPVPEFENYFSLLPACERKYIHRLGCVDHEELKLWYRGADLFIFPSIAEGFGIPPIEAAATGMPVICHNSTAMSEYTFLGENLIDVESYNTFKAVIEKNLENPVPKEKLAEIQAEIRENYSWDSAAEVLRFAFLGIL